MFRKITPGQFSLLVLLISVIFPAGLLLLLQRGPLYYLVPGSLLYLVFLFFLIRYLTVRMIMNKIMSLFREIPDLKIPEKELRKKLKKKDFFPEVEHNMLDWIQKKNREIVQLKEMEKYRREFLGNVSHELKTPIFNIQGYVLTLLDGGLEDTGINRMFLERTEKSINRMIAIVQDLESISRLESGMLSLQYESFDMIKLVEEVYENLELTARERKITLAVVYDPSLAPLLVRADRKRIYEVMNNLVKNSISYGREKGKTTVSLDSTVDHCLIRVEDNGLGIPPDDLPRIFERFYRVDRSRSRNLGGTGLGLAIVKHIIEAHNSTIRVESAWKKGSEFSFTLEKGSA